MVVLSLWEMELYGAKPIRVIEAALRQRCAYRRQEGLPSEREECGCEGGGVWSGERNGIWHPPDEVAQHATWGE